MNAGIIYDPDCSSRGGSLSLNVEKTAIVSNISYDFGTIPVPLNTCLKNGLQLESSGESSQHKITAKIQSRIW